MRSYVPAFTAVRATKLADVTAKLADASTPWQPLAGGTDIMVLFEAGMLKHTHYVNIWGLSELKGISDTPTHIELGALTTYAEMQSHPLLRQEFPAIAQAAAATGAVAIQNRGTLGGNIANASPAADTPPALLVYDAELLLVSSHGERWVDYQNFHTGYKSTMLNRGELIARVRLPRLSAGDQKARRHYYRKVGTRKAQAISKLMLAATADLDTGGNLAHLRLALGSVGPVTLRCPRTEAMLCGVRLSRPLITAAVKSLATEFTPLDDIRSTAKLRRLVAQNLLEEFLLSLLPASSAAGGAHP